MAVDASRIAKRIRVHNFVALEKAQRKLESKLFFDCTRTFGFVNPSLVFCFPFVVNHSKKAIKMKVLVSPGITPIKTYVHRTPVRRPAAWPSHGNLFGTNVGPVLGPTYGCELFWTLKNGTLYLYRYRLGTITTAGNDQNTINGSTTQRGLLGGEFYNGILRATIVLKS